MRGSVTEGLYSLPKERPRTSNGCTLLASLAVTSVSFTFTAGKQSAYYSFQDGEQTGTFIQNMEIVLEKEVK